MLAWQWLSQGDELQQAKGALVCLLLLCLLGGLMLLTHTLWYLFRLRVPDFQGFANPAPLPCRGKRSADYCRLSA